MHSSMEHITRALKNDTDCSGGGKDEASPAVWCSCVVSSLPDFERRSNCPKRCWDAGLLACRSSLKLVSAPIVKDCDGWAKDTMTEMTAWRWGPVEAFGGLPKGLIERLAGCVKFTHSPLHTSLGG
ncbi:hypothetical protein HZ326_26536 [Fusarium oxysporum f. sp. albedinis]|nr:hypothetical protein HZ326_26536 [Fusarium oxysporum f. sp. albedinis]